MTVQTMTPSKISFVRDVMPIINKVGCTSGTCHGAAKGKNGFKLSLRGYDPHFDYEMLVHDVSGRRINRVDPPRSLALAKPTMQVAHGGGMRFDLDSRYYQTLLQWISQGTLYGDPAASQVKRIEVLPGEILMPRPGLAQQIQVIAHYADGANRDVTREASYTSSVPTVAEVTQDGHLTTLRRGEAALLIRYEGRFVPLPVTVLEGRPGFQWTQLPQHNYIDRHVDAKLKKVETLPSEIASDAEFLRRVYLDLIGIPPTPEETRAFLAEPGEQRLKRSRWIDKLMARPEFVDHWAVKWGDLFQNTRKFVGDKGVWQYRDWIKRSLAENKPYDQWVREVLTAQGSTFENPAANFFRIAKDPKVAMETTTQVFLGIRMVCAQCHDHPFEQWTQNQYYQMAAFFSTIGVKEGIDSQEEIVYVKRNEKERDIKHPKSGNIVPAKYLFGDPKGISQEGDRRDDLVRWLTSKDNPYFAKAVANRIWSYFFGRGIIDPVDDIRAGNPPSNEPLLDSTDEGFDGSQFRLAASHSHHRELPHLSADLSHERVEPGRRGEFLTCLAETFACRNAVRCHQRGYRQHFEVQGCAAEFSSTAVSRSHGGDGWLPRFVRPAAARLGLRVRAPQRRQLVAGAEPDQWLDGVGRYRRSRRTHCAVGDRQGARQEVGGRAVPCGTQPPTGPQGVRAGAELSGSEPESR